MREISIDRRRARALPRATPKSVALSTGVTLSYVEQGDAGGIPLVLLHGITDSWRSFEPVLPQLPGWLRVFALTQRGHGDARRRAPGYRTRDFAADVAAFMDVQGIESAVVVGHSMGATNAQRFAVDHPARVRGLVTVGTFASCRDNPVMADLWQSTIALLTDPIDPRFVREFQAGTVARPVPSSLLDTAVKESLKVPAYVWRTAFAGLMEDACAGQFARIAAPTLLLWGDRDALVPRADQAKLLRSIAGARLLVYQGAGHAPHWEEPRRFALDLTAFVQRLGEEQLASA